MGRVPACAGPLPPKTDGLRDLKESSCIFTHDLFLVRLRKIQFVDGSNCAWNISQRIKRIIRAKHQFIHTGTLDRAHD